jgi:peptidoglycan/LPS O-acetylase OafA/YrhL
MQARGDNMKSANENGTLARSNSSMGFPVASATLLILFGLVFQVVELTCRNLQLGNLWLLSVLASDIWNILSVHFNVPSIGDALLYWPLLMICMGLAILLAVRENRPSRARKDS